MLRRTPAAVLVAAALVAGAVRPAAAAGPLFGPPVPLATNAADDVGDDTGPRLATDGAGNWVAVWTSGDAFSGTIGLDLDILTARSDDDGATWTDPVPLASWAYTDGATDSSPVVATDGTTWVVAWSSTYTINGTGGTLGPDRDILVVRSTDAGATWSDPVALASNAADDSGGDDLPVLAVSATGTWIAAWQSFDKLGNTIGTDADILFARSTNAVDWSPVAPLNSNADMDAGNDRQPDLATDGAGHWVAVWYSADELTGVGTDNDVFVSRSSDDGVGWTDPVALNSNAVGDDANDREARVATDGLGHWLAVWRSNDTLGDTIGTDNDILVARSSNNGGSWTTAAALNGDATVDSGNDSLPVVATDGATWVAIWASNSSLGNTIDIEGDLLTARSSNAGAGWTLPVAFNTNAADDSGLDTAPDLVQDGAGRWIAAWQSADALDDRIETDLDVLVAVGSEVCGNGVLDPGEQCDDGSDCCSAGCLYELAGTVCRPATEACDAAERCTGTSTVCPADTGFVDSDGDGTCNGLDVCPAVPDPAQVDGDGDGRGDECDPCTGGGAFTKPKLSVSGFHHPGPDDSYKLGGRMTLAAAFDPIATGVRLILEDRQGAPIADATIPPGAFDPTTKVGWKVNRRGTSWLYNNKQGVNGVVKVTLRRLRQHPEMVAVTVKARRGDFPIAPGQIPVTAIVVLDPPLARTGLCGQAEFPGPRPAPTCAFNAIGTRLRCR